MKSILLIGLTALLLASCQKSNIGDHRDYVGIWTNKSGDVTHKLEVKSNGKAFFEITTKSGKWNKSISHEGRFILDGSTLKIGLKKLTINKEPSFSNGIWLLTMENNVYTGK